MGKKDRKDAKTDTKALASDAKSEYDVSEAANTNRISALDQTNLTNRDEIANLYRGLAGKTTGGGYGGGSGNGGASLAPLGGVYDASMDFAKTGGYSPEREASIMENVHGLKEFGRTGGMNEEDAARFRANGTYDEFNRTGGYTDADKARIRQVSLAPISSYASNTQDELNRRQAVQGGYGPGFDSAARALRRDAAKGMYEAGLASEMNVKEAVNQGRQWGAKGMTDAENTYQTLKTGNQYKGLMGASDVELQLQDSISKYRLGGLNNAQATAAAMGDLEKFNLQNGQSLDLASIQGLEGLYNKDYASAEHGRDLASGLMGDEYQARTGINSQLNELRMTPGLMEKLALAGVGGFAGAAGGALTGGVGTALNSASKTGQNLPGGLANPSLNKPRYY